MRNIENLKNHHNHHHHRHPDLDHCSVSDPDTDDDAGGAVEKDTSKTNGNSNNPANINLSGEVISFRGLRSD